jgi:hypothetical protein
MLLEVDIGMDYGKVSGSYQALACPGKGQERVALLGKAESGHLDDSSCLAYGHTLFWINSVNNAIYNIMHFNHLCMHKPSGATIGKLFITRDE